MKDRFETWLQIIIPTIASLIFGGVGLYLLTQFKERLPVWFYNALIYVIYFVFVAILVLFLVLIIRAAFGDWLKGLMRLVKKTRQQRARTKLTAQWYEKWRELSLLLYDVAKHKWKPTKKQEEDFSKLRIWFIINRTEFLHIWHSFMYYRRSMAHEGYSSSTSLGYEVFYNNHDDPFSYFYEPLSIDQLEHLLQYHHNEMPEVILKLKERLDESIEWVNKEQ